MQRAITKAFRSRANLADLSAAPVAKINRNALQTDDDGYVYPAKIYYVDSMTDMDFQQFEADPTLLLGIESTSSSYMKKATGVNDPSMGYADPVLKSGGGMGAQVFNAQQADSVFNAIVQTGDQALSSLGRIIFLQYVNNRELVDLSFMDEDDARLISELFEKCSDPVYAASVSITVSAVDVGGEREAKAQRAIQASTVYEKYVEGNMSLISVITSQNPQVPQEARDFAAQALAGSTLFMKDLLTSLGFKYPEKALPDLTKLSEALDEKDKQGGIELAARIGQGGPQGAAEQQIAAPGGAGTSGVPGAPGEGTGRVVDTQALYQGGGQQAPAGPTVAPGQ